jgi:predicted acyltransferase
MPHSSRLASIDCFRGFAVLAMALASYLTGTEALPARLRHAPDGRPTSVDFDSPCFDFRFETKGVTVCHDLV